MTTTYICDYCEKPHPRDTVYCPVETADLKEVCDMCNGRGYEVCGGEYAGRCAHCPTGRKGRV